MKDEVKESFLKEGRRYREKIIEKITNEQSRKIVLDEFTEKLTEKYLTEDERREKNQRYLCTAAAIFGVAGGASLVALPVFLAFAVAAEVATGLVIAGGAVGGGVVGGAATGGIAGTVKAIANIGASNTPPNLDQPDDEDSKKASPNKDKK